MADLDGDGVRDVLTGSWPGELYVFKGTRGEDGRTTHAAPTKLVDKDGTILNTGNASVVQAVDWDADGDLDLVVGCIEGWVWFVPNESGGKGLAFGTPTKLEAGGAPIHQHHSGPAVADWDGNGTLDLIVGQGDGNVVWYANASKQGAPVLAAAQVLYRGAATGDGTKPAGRVKPCVVDWNGDGKPDLLVGDFGMKMPEPKELGEVEQAWMEAWRAEQAVLAEELRVHYGVATAKALKALGLDVDADDAAAVSRAFQTLTTEQRNDYSRHFAEAVQGLEAVQELQERMRALQAKMEPYQGRAEMLGNVWLLERFDPAAAAAAAGKAAGEK